MTNHKNIDGSSTGVLTLHYGFNEGAVLQSMATCQLVRSLGKGNEVEVVDHRYPAKQRIYGDADTARSKAILESVNHWLPLSPQRFESSDHKPTFKYCEDRYRSLVVGSDVVWALRYVGRLRRWIPGGILPRQADPFFPAFPNVYWPDESVDCKKVTYAACCGNLDPSEVPAGHRRKMAKILDGFAGISVRDTKSLELVRQCSRELARRTIVVPDPTVAFNLLDVFDGSSALEKLRHHGFDESKPWALLVMKQSAVSHMAMRLLKSRGLRVAATGDFDGEADIDLIQCGLNPLEWGWMPRYFGLNVTERMHSSIFTVLNSTPLVALDMNRQISGTNTKLEERMEGFGLSRFYLHQNQVVENVLAALIEEACRNSVEWDKVGQRIEAERQVAREFLSAGLGQCE